MPTRERTLYRILSLVVAVALWYMVGADRNPDVERTVSVELRARGLPVGLQVLRLPSRVEVRVRGPRSAMAELGANSVAAYVDLGDVTEPGEYRVPVRAQASSSAVRVISVDPDEVVVSIDATARRQLPVEVALQGSPLPGAVVGQPTVQPTRVTVHGPRSLVQQVQRAWVAVDVSGLRTSLTQSLRVRLVDASGAELSGLVVEPQNVQVTVPVGEGTLTRMVPVVPTVTGQPRPGLSVALLEATPSLVTVRGPQDALVNLSVLLTEPVDVSAVEGEVQRRVRLQLPRGVRVEEGSVVSIRMVVLPTPVSREFAVVVQLRGADPGLEVALRPSAVRVAVVGPKEAVERLRPEQVEAYVTVTGQESPSSKLPVRLKLPGGVVVAWVDPQEVTATVRRR